MNDAAKTKPLSAKEFLAIKRTATSERELALIATLDKELAISEANLKRWEAHQMAEHGRATETRMRANALAQMMCALAVKGGGTVAVPLSEIELVSKAGASFEIVAGNEFLIFRLTKKINNLSDLS